MVQTRTYRVEVWTTARRTSDNRWVNTARQMGIFSTVGCEAIRLFFIQGALTSADVDLLARELLVDPVTETYSIDESPLAADHSVEVTLLPGVTDPAADNLVRAAHLLGMAQVERAATGMRFLLTGAFLPDDLNALATKVFSNPVIQRCQIDAPISAPFVAHAPSAGTVETIVVRGADDDRLLAISAERRLALDLPEMQAIRDYYESEDRDPTDVELEMIAQTWSEHCVHKTFRALIDSPDGQIDGLLRTYIRAATEKVNKSWVRSAFVDNAGIIAFNDEYDLAFKVETHNHPSALEPFGGANTGVGGVVRDILGVSARPIANTDVLCFGLPDADPASLPENVLHPARIADGVIAGVEDYGNKMGIPTVNGAVLYHPGYTANPLVFCGCLGLLPRDSHPTTPRAGDLIIVIGGRTGRDGLRGATFSSMEMDTATSTTAGSAVQIGNPIQEKQVQEVVLRARDERLYNAITDCGAGGLSSAVGEIGKDIGVRVQLQDVPLKYPGLLPWEIWLSEAQERMVLAVSPEHWERLQAICAGQDVEAVCVGEFEPTGRLTLCYGERQVGALSMDFLHDGIPQRRLTAEYTEPELADEPRFEIDHQQALLDLLAHPNIRSKEAVVRVYDHEVQGGTAVKPLVGTGEHGHGDAAVIAPLGTYQPNDTPVKGVVLSNGVCPQYGEIDPYAMAWAAVDEAFRNAVAVGADPDQIAILDNFCWGNPKLPDRMGSLLRCTQGCYDAALAYNTPFISGKDSLNNEYMGADGQRHAIPGTLLISAVGIVPDVAQTVTSDLKAADGVLFLIGETRAEFGGSHLNIVMGQDGGLAPQPNADALTIMRALHNAIRKGLVRACHDVSEGGIGVALAEMCIGGQLGATIDTAPIHLDSVTALYAESTGRFLVEVAPEKADAFAELLADVPHAHIGHVTANARFTVEQDGFVLFGVALVELERRWRGDVTAVTPAPAARPVAQRAFIHTHKPRALILHANGTNRDREAALAIEMAGGAAEIVHINQIAAGERDLLDYQLLIVPGGFSYGDDLGAGVLWALDLRRRFADAVDGFIDRRRPVLGICNGFQALVKAGLLSTGAPTAARNVTLTYNESGRFECRWVYLQPNAASPCLFTDGLDELIYCPVAHGEGRVMFSDQAAEMLRAAGLVALTYVSPDGSGAGYPANPNGSAYAIAGITNPAGNILGLMPHPEDHIFAWQHPRRHRGESGLLGLRLFENAVRFA